jgi:hypothetical protein
MRKSDGRIPASIPLVIVLAVAMMAAVPAIAQDDPAATKSWAQFGLDVKLSDAAGTNADLKTVLQDILREYDRLVPAGPALGRRDIEVVWSDKSPLADVSGLPGKYRILLAVKDRLYSQLAYQFAHEMCHVYCNPRVSNWLIESLGEMCSLYFLEVLAKKWETDPPYPHWKDYAPSFRKYREERIDSVLKQFRVARRAGNKDLIREKLAKSDAACQRELNTLIALELLTVFEKFAEAWPILAHFGGAVEKPPASQTFDGDTKPDLDKLIQLLPEDLKEFGKAVRDALR